VCGKKKNLYCGAREHSKATSLTANLPGFIGRFLARYVHENDLASEILIVDKQLPQLAWLAPEFSDACAPERFVQGDMSRESTAYFYFFSFFLFFDRIPGVLTEGSKKTPPKKSLRARMGVRGTMFSTAAVRIGSRRMTKFINSAR